MAGAMLYEIQKAGFEISAIQSVKFTKPNAEEFLEVYKGVLHEYPVIKGFFLGLCLSHMFFIESSHKKKHENRNKVLPHRNHDIHYF